jgi:hypothetical protein
MIAPKPAEPRELPFDHEGDRFKVTASPGVNGYELALWRGESLVQKVGFISWDDISQATRSGFHDDLVGGAMNTVRDAVLTKNAGASEPMRSGNGD